MAFEPKKAYSIIGMHKTSSYYSIWTPDEPLKVRFVQDETIKGKRWHVYITSDIYHDHISLEDVPVLARVRIPEDNIKVTPDVIDAGENIVKNRILSTRGSNATHYNRTDNINKFIDKAHSLFKDDTSPEVSSLKELLEKDVKE